VEKKLIHASYGRRKYWTDSATIRPAELAGRIVFRFSLTASARRG